MMSPSQMKLNNIHFYIYQGDISKVSQIHLIMKRLEKDVFLLIT